MGTIAAMTLPVAALIWERKAIAQERVELLDRERKARRGRGRESGEGRVPRHAES